MHGSLGRDWLRLYLLDLLASPILTIWRKLQVPRLNAIPLPT